jgi:hypothetical protein
MLTAIERVADIHSRWQNNLWFFFLLLNCSRLRFSLYKVQKSHSHFFFLSVFHSFIHQSTYKRLYFLFQVWDTLFTKSGVFICDFLPLRVNLLNASRKTDIWLLFERHSKFCLGGICVYVTKIFSVCFFLYIIYCDQGWLYQMREYCWARVSWGFQIAQFSKQTFKSEHFFLASPGTCNGHRKLDANRIKIGAKRTRGRGHYDAATPSWIFNSVLFHALSQKSFVQNTKKIGSELRKPRWRP